MPTTEEVFSQHRHLFGTVPGLENTWVCQRCLGPVSERFVQCYGCYELFIKRWSPPPAELWTAIVPMTAALSPSEWYGMLWTYKSGNNWHAAVLVSLAYTWLDANGARVAALLGGEPDALTVVPSTKGVVAARQPLRVALSWIEPFRERLVTALEWTGEKVERRRYQPDAFRAGPEDIRGRRVLLIEDTWVTGSKALSAGGALLRDGARSVAIVPVARMVEHQAWEGHPYLEAMTTPYDPSHWPR